MFFSGSFTSPEINVMLFQVTIAKIAPTVAAAIISIFANEKSALLIVFVKFALIVSKLHPKKIPKTIIPTIPLINT